MELTLDDNRVSALWRHAMELRSLNDSYRDRSWESIRTHGQTNADHIQRSVSGISPSSLPHSFLMYWLDSMQRGWLFLDALHQRSSHFLAHEGGANASVLTFDFDTIVDGSQLARPVNYSLVRIRPAPGTLQREDGRPYIVIDPRAGHGSGIGGFKQQSEVGCALAEGHPVYFVIFNRLPIGEQTIADVCAAEAGFVREVRRLHPDSPKPVIVGNCQGGWASMLLAATNPDITGPVVVNGAPLSYWKGIRGKNPMRYLGGLVGGTAITMLLSDLGAGRFDGAHLVYNFEKANPGRTWWKKYYDLYDKVDTESARFVEFERWWGSFYFMSAQEIQWIVENLFVGNRLARGQAMLDARTHIDLRDIQSPVIVFASHGDNITPPQQALGWIADHYKNVDEIRARGQRILYTLHESVGHLGIFVSSSVARREHSQIFSTLKAIEALAPGLYELVIEQEEGTGIDKQFTVTFEERSIEYMLHQAGGMDDPAPFAAVARLSELGAQAYDLLARPVLKPLANQYTAEFASALHPLRIKRYITSDHNPLMTPVPALAAYSRKHRVAIDSSNPLRQWERLAAGMITQAWDSVRDWQDYWIETTFLSLYAHPRVAELGKPHMQRISDAPMEDLRSLVKVQDALDRLEEGGFAEGLIRMLILLARSRKEVRRQRLDKANAVLAATPPFSTMKPKQLTRLIHRESLIVAFEPEAALETLGSHFHDDTERQRALTICRDIAGPLSEMTPETVAMMSQLELSLKAA